VQVVDVPAPTVRGRGPSPVAALSG
jgi:hypothetical protein